ncbi:MAG TPA: PEGA domain-containing protein, partial [Candidatus Polarisedimenticolia bacterium]|nr:PEGA domain-containing protein [Candidatus Polarisedimenticolia bacterium]
MSRRPALLAAALALGVCVAAPSGLAPSPALAQQEEDLTAGLRAMRAAYDRARERIDNLDFAGAIRELGAIIEPRRSVRPGDLAQEELDVLGAAYDMRARAYFNLGNLKAAEADFSALVRLDPGYSIDRQTLSPKVVDLFDRVRARIAGILTLQIDPPKARVTIDGAAVDLPSAGGLALLAGSHPLRIEMDGFDPFVETLAISAGTEIKRVVHLKANRRALQFITVPAGVSITLDGAPVGTTRGPATPDVEGLAAQFGFDPKNAAAPFLVPLVAPGDHRVTFERECFQSQTLALKVTLDPEQNVPLKYSPVILQEARTDLRLTSTPSGADVFVDGEKKGTTPLVVAAVCGGEREVVVSKPEAGTWSERIRLQAGQVNTLDVRLRPTLLYAGTFRLDEWGRAVWSDEDKTLLEEIGKGLKTLNLVRAPDVLQEMRGAIIGWMISDPADVRAGTILPPAILEMAASKAHADLVLAGLTLNGDPDKVWTVALYSVLHGSPD